MLVIGLHIPFLKPFNTSTLSNSPNYENITIDIYSRYFGRYLHSKEKRLVYSIEFKWTSHSQ